MSAEIIVRRIKHKNYILEFTVNDSYCIFVTLLTDKDRTLTDTNYIHIANKVIVRDCVIDESSGDVVEGSFEGLSDFAERSILEAREWADEEIEERAETIQLATTLEKLLPPSINE